MSGMHEDEFDIDTALVVRLLERSAPHLADRPVRPLATQGSSNALFRLGDDLLVRLPRQPAGSAAIGKEARWLPYVASALPVAVPEVLVVGRPGLGYPESWSVVRWIAGRTPEAGRAPNAVSGDLALTVSALARLPVPSAARGDPTLRGYRGGPLAAIDAEIRDYLAQCRKLPLELDLDSCERIWTSAVALDRAGADVEPRWVHGDLTAENLLMRAGRVVAVVDFGALCVGDPVVDLVVAWEVLSRDQRAAFRAALDVDDETWLVVGAIAAVRRVVTCVSGGGLYRATGSGRHHSGRRTQRWPRTNPATTSWLLD